MTPKLLVVPGASEALHPLLDDLRRSDGVTVETVPTFARAIQVCSNGGRPDAVAAQLDDQVPGLLELLIALDGEAGSVPCLALLNGGTGRSLPIETGRSLLLRAATDPADSLRAALLSSLRETMAKAARRRSVDYLLSGILSRRSITLDLTLESGASATVEVLGGDVWNVYCDGLEALPALGSILFERVVGAEVRTLNTIPGERQIRVSGLEAVSPAARRLAAGAGPGTVPIDVIEDPGTREIFLDARADEPEPEPASSMPVSPAPASSTPVSPDERFDRLLAQGIQASLSRDYRRAAEAFESALELRPDDQRVKFNLDRVRSHLGG